MTAEQILASLGLTRETVAALAAGKPPPVRIRPLDPRPRPICLVCGKPINAIDCAPVIFRDEPPI